MLSTCLSLSPPKYLSKFRSVLLPGKFHGWRAWQAAVHGVAKSRTRLSDFTFTFHFHALEKAMATHSSVLAFRIPGRGEPGGLPSMGLHRVGHDWSNLAADLFSTPHVRREDPIPPHASMTSEPHLLGNHVPLLTLSYLPFNLSLSWGEGVVQAQTN